MFNSILFLLSLNTFAQNTISGKFPLLAGQEVKLMGFENFDSYVIDSTEVLEDGRFSLHYGEKNSGMGFLAAADNNAYYVVMAKENTQLKGESLSLPQTVEVILGNENKLFAQYASEHPRREQALSAWDYLDKMYTEDPLFASHKEKQQAIEKEKIRIVAEDNLFLASLEDGSFLSWYLPLRKFVSSVSAIAQYRPAEIPAAISSFRALDYADARLFNSGLLKDVIERHFWLIENSGHSLDSTYIEMNISIDSILKSLWSDKQKLNQITDFLFKLLEKRSLFKSSEYLALKVLDQKACCIDNNLASQLESYRAMKIGNIAPDFEFPGDVFAPGYAKAPMRFSDLQTNYTVLIFGSSWCPSCAQELVQIIGFYKDWKENAIEVVFISLDQDEEVFKNFISPFPFISMSDYKKGDGPIVESYHVFATPTIFLLDNKREILLRPHSVSQVNLWVEQVLNGN